MTSSNASSGTSAAERIETVRSRMSAAATDAGRRPQDVELVAVSKTFDMPDIVPYIDAGLRVGHFEKLSTAMRRDGARVGTLVAVGTGRNESDGREIGLRR